MHIIKDEKIRDYNIKITAIKFYSIGDTKGFHRRAVRWEPYLPYVQQLFLF